MYVGSIRYAIVTRREGVIQGFETSGESKLFLVLLCKDIV
jgi:hypothetical protein